jgi:hypothetical protein
MSWGTKITILYSGFVLLIVSMVYMAMNQKMDLVSKDYYEQELHFQDKINSAANLSALQEPLNYEIKGDELIIEFPSSFHAQKINGNILFQYVSDAGMDQSFSIVADADGKMHIGIADFKKGVYKMMVNWDAGGKGYYFEAMVKL